jgi:putative PEP-CTERM system TPR-repeat lipoprotein
MRKRLLLAVPPLLVVLLACAWLLFGRTGDPLAAARLRIARNDMKGASLYLRDAIRAQPKNALAAFLLGKVDLALGRPTNAQYELQRARTLGYDQAAIVLPLGIAYLQQHNFAQLLQDFPVEKTSGADVRAQTLGLRATAQMSLRDLDAAATSASAAEALDPGDPYVLLAAARIALAHGDESGAAARIEKILSLPATAADDSTRDDALLLQGELAMRHDEPKVALANARTVLQHRPARLDARLLEARALAAGGDEKAARADVDAVLRRAPKDIAANFLRVVLAIHTGDYAAADASLLQIGPAISDLPRGYYVLAVTKVGLKQFDAADEAATQFLAQAPDDIPGLKLMAFIDLARNHADRALALLHDSALAKHPDADTFDLRGRALALAGDMKAAQESLARAAALHPADPSILNRLAAVEINLGNIPAGEADLKHSLALAPKQGRTGAAIVEADLARFDLDAARQDLDRLRATLGNDETIGLLDAQLKLATLDTNGAEAELRALSKRFPNSRAAVLFLVRIAALRGDTAQANALLEAGLSKRPADSGFLELLLPSLLANHATGEAVHLAEAAHDAAPADPGLTATLAEIYVRTGQAGRAEGLLDRASAGNNAQLDLMRAGILAQQGDKGRAETILQAILEKDPANVRARTFYATLQIKAGDFAGARTLLHDGLKQVPGNAQLLGALVVTDLKQAGSPQAGLKAALATASALRANRANLPAAYALPGEIYLAAGDAKSAAAAFLAAYKTAPSSDLAIQAASASARAGNAAQAAAVLDSWTTAHPADVKAQLVLSSLDLETGQLSQAAQALQAVIATDGTNAAALNNLAWIRQRQGDQAEAKALGERAYFVAPGPETADTLGWILAQQGDTGGALPLLKQAAAGAGPNLHAAAAYHYAVALAAAGQRDEARSEVQSALASKASFRERDDAERFLSTLK